MCLTILVKYFWSRYCSNIQVISGVCNLVGGDCEGLIKFPSQNIFDINVIVAIAGSQAQAFLNTPNTKKIVIGAKEDTMGCC